MTTTTIIFLLVFGGVGAWFLGYGLWCFVYAVSCPEWPQVAGAVVTSDLQRSVDRNGATYRAEVVYKYTIAGREYVADRVFFGDAFYSSFTAAAVREVERYQPGSSVQVRYDAQNPQRAVLEAGVNWQLYLILGLGAVLTGVAIAVYLGRLPVTS
jgi:hypothetical protein